MNSLYIVCRNSIGSVKPVIATNDQETAEKLSESINSTGLDDARNGVFEVPYLQEAKPIFRDAEVL